MHVFDGRDIWVASTLFVQLKQAMDKTPYITVSSI